MNLGTKQSGDGQTEIEAPPFLVKTFQLVSDASHHALVGWSPNKDSFIIYNPVEFSTEILPKYFKHNNFSSFIRCHLASLMRHGWEFKHEFFREGRPELLRKIQRRKPRRRDEVSIRQSHAPSSPPSPPTATSPPPPSHAQTGRDSTERAIQDLSQSLTSRAAPAVNELEKGGEGNKSVDQVLMMEVLRLRKQHDATQNTMKLILEELVASRRAQQTLQSQVETLTQFSPAASTLPPYATVPAILSYPPPLHPSSSANGSSSSSSLAAGVPFPGFSVPPQASLYPGAALPPLQESGRKRSLPHPPSASSAISASSSSSTVSLLEDERANLESALALNSLKRQKS